MTALNVSNAASTEYDAQLKNRCYACGTITSALNNHELGCVRGYGPNINVRHNGVRDELANTLQEIGGIVEIEPLPFPNSNLRTDIRWVIDGYDYHFDVSIINPLGILYIHQAAKRCLGAAAEREKDKRKKYDQLSKHQRRIYPCCDRKLRWFW